MLPDSAAVRIEGQDGLPRGRPRPSLPADRPGRLRPRHGRWTPARRAQVAGPYCDLGRRDVDVSHRQVAPRLRGDWNELARAVRSEMDRHEIDFTAVPHRE